MLRPSSIVVASSLLAAGLASASTVYDVAVDTSSVNGTVGSLDFNFNPGPSTTQFALLQILIFASDGTLVNCAANVQGFCPTGDVSGQLPTTLTFDNATAFNDYFDDFTFGTTLSFEVSLYGPALTSPDGVSTSGSTFAFSMFSDAAGILPVLTTDTIDGFAFLVDINLDGTTTVSNFSLESTIVSTPEPSTSTLLGTGMASVVLLQLIRAGLRRRLF
jgi:hypothetical protein